MAYLDNGHAQMATEFEDVELHYYLIPYKNKFTWIKERSRYKMLHKKEITRKCISVYSLGGGKFSYPKEEPYVLKETCMCLLYRNIDYKPYIK